LDEPFFLDVEAVLALYDDMANTFGVGLVALELSKLKGALSRIESNYYYGDPEPCIPRLGGLVGYSIAKAHAFGDGNKRTALACMDLFLIQNGWENTADGMVTAIKVEAVVGNEISEEAFLLWVISNCAPLPN
jgi:death-on-curing protein